MTTTRSFLLGSLPILMLAACNTREDFHPANRNYSNLPPKLSTIAGEQVAKDQAITAHVGSLQDNVAAIRSLAKGSPAEAGINARLDAMGLDLKSILAEIKAHPGAKVGKLATALDDKMDEDLKPDWRVTYSLYGFAGLCTTLAFLVTFCMGWLSTVPVLGKFLADTLGQYAALLLLGLASMAVVTARFYSWAVKHPYWFDAACIVFVALVVLMFMNKYYHPQLLKIEARILGLFKKSQPAPTT